MMSEERWQDVTVDETFELKPRQWLQKEANQDMPYLLAHADDGVIWGKLDKSGKLVLSSDIFSEVKDKLRAKTLQQARLFGKAGDLLLWRVNKSFVGRLIRDGSVPPDDAFEERHYLWGEGIKSESGFTLMQEGQQGLRHAPPLPDAKGARTALKVRHYVDYDDQDQAYISLSRLVDLIKVKGKTA
jgi:CRISPR-associated protein (TIGR03984 family)